MSHTATSSSSERLTITLLHHCIRTQQPIMAKTEATKPTKITKPWAMVHAKRYLCAVSFCAVVLSMVAKACD
eukprot:CAMPEP_0175176826 /NCGR_PEP_ID=MMETSP0087-20121206/34021_1 /TAXON_ID=136419 /ORGANISM="Unknown Unknown, Strain D1" /LENGTH=71 /DNA_ID=CAMNT_0016468685 /DNA_START=14 /DNA_END=229 /DNA_ORIENTATION=+